MDTRMAKDVEPMSQGARLVIVAIGTGAELKRCFGCVSSLEAIDRRLTAPPVATRFIAMK